MAVMRALRRTGHEDFPNAVRELQTPSRSGRTGAAVRALPGEGTEVPLWILGSSLYGAELAAHLGLPYAFASHFAPDALEDAFRLYRETFRPSAQLARPHAMLAVNVFAADTEAEARRLRTSMQQAFAQLRLGTPGKLPRPVDDLDAAIGAPIARAVDHALRVSAVGTEAQIRDQLAAFISRHAPDEIILTGTIHDHAARLRSFEIAAEAMDGLDRAAA